MGDEVIFYRGEGGEAERFAVGGKLRDRSYSGVWEEMIELCVSRTHIHASSPHPSQYIQTSPTLLPYISINDPVLCFSRILLYQIRFFLFLKFYEKLKEMRSAAGVEHRNTFVMGTAYTGVGISGFGSCTLKHV